MKNGKGWIWVVPIAIVVIAVISGSSTPEPGSPEWCSDKGLTVATCNDLHKIVDTWGSESSPMPTFSDGTPMGQDLVDLGEVCDRRHPLDDAAFTECVLRSGHPVEDGRPSSAVSASTTTTIRRTQTTTPKPTTTSTIQIYDEPDFTIQASATCQTGAFSVDVEVTNTSQSVFNLDDIGVGYDIIGHALAPMIDMFEERPLAPSETFDVQQTWTEEPLPSVGDNIYIYVAAGVGDWSYPQEITIACGSN